MMLQKEDKQTIVRDFGQSPQDTGSIEVQVALLTSNIHLLTGHCQRHSKDFSSRRGLLKMVCRRRRFLRYLEKNDAAKYKSVIERLGLRK